ncbi:hypothetical protein PFTANZ_06428 [Plasmodium falciparum Tanzania (2000708)]|uniref:Surface antigen n=1 Tax=Plasmodium falciparum Tanzania (2000708) TaxID=1036725 RepID=A0A024VX13_PLAFA|nr:hypothetical protein PFTANZ_06428 [Plasmodium falciparum Tanzania (2000708)]
MKRVMQQFVDRTTQRFHEYDERMKTTRQKCKEQCNKEIQKIILKDKLEKQMVEQFSTLQTDIQNDAIPTCVCEKSIADKVEKTCLKCGGVLGGGIAPGWGLISGIVYTGWKAAALAAAKSSAIAEGLAAGEAAGAQAGVNAVISKLSSLFGVSNLDSKPLVLFINAQNYRDAQLISKAIYNKFIGSCMSVVPVPGGYPGPSLIVVTDKNFCTLFEKFVPTNGSSNRDSIINAIKEYVKPIVSQAEGPAKAAAETVTKNATTTLTAKNTGEVNATYASFQTPIIASIVAIVVIALVMLIIYLILRYRRKKKMKKKLQYIKLLEE